MKKQPATQSVFIGKAAAILFVCCFFLFFFRSVIFEGRQFSFRDGANFYYPLFEYVHSYWKAGIMPFWDTMENAGGPLAASGSAAVFYPGQLLFFLSDFTPISYGRCFALYHLLHMALALCGLFCLARHWRISFYGSLLAAFCYTFCGSIFGQYCNTIFLVGAAWLPWGILYGDRLLVRRDARSFVLLAVVLAMMVLGGEPQSAWFAGAMLGGLWFVYWRAGRFDVLTVPDTGKSAQSQPARTDRLRAILRSRPAILLYAATLGGMLSLVQIVPTMEMSKLSDRVTDHDVPISLWDVPGFLARRSSEKTANGAASPERKSPYVFYDEPDLSEQSDLTTVLDGLFCRKLEYGGHARVIYHYSLGPWRLGEFFWPNVTGKAPPNASRWSAYLPEDYEWTYSLYFGIAPMLLALSVVGRCLRRRKRTVAEKDGKRKHRRKKDACPVPSPLRIVRVWCTWVAVVSLVAALGAYGPVWLARALSVLCGGNAKLMFTNYDPLGGLYWFISVVTPMFSSFRYPSKLVTPAILALTILAGFGWDLGRANRRFVPIVRGYLVVSLVLLAAVWMGGEKAFEMTQLEYSSGAMFDAYFAANAYRVVLGGIALGIAAALLFATVYTTPRQRKRLTAFGRSKVESSAPPPMGTGHARSAVKTAIRTAIAMSLVAADVYLANENLLVTSPQSMFDKCPAYVREIEANEQKTPRSGAEQVRYYRFSWYPYAFVTPKTKANITDRHGWERDTLYPKFNERYHYGGFMGATTMYPRDYYAVYEWLGWITARRDITPTLAFLGCDYLVFPIEVQNETGVSARVRFRNDWARLLSTSENMPDDELRQKDLPVSATLWETLLPHERVKILRNPELDRPEWTTIDQLDAGYVNHAAGGEYAKIVTYTPNRVEMDVKLASPASLVLAEQYFPGWTATVAPLTAPETSKPVVLTKTLDFMRRIQLPAGEFRVCMTYMPTRFVPAAVLTLFGWLTAFALFFLYPRFACISGKSETSHASV